jgi:hypothetical protein
MPSLGGGVYTNYVANYVATQTKPTPVGAVSMGTNVVVYKIYRSIQRTRVLVFNGTMVPDSGGSIAENYDMTYRKNKQTFCGSICMATKIYTDTERKL